MMPNEADPEDYGRKFAVSHRPPSALPDGESSLRAELARLASELAESHRARDGAVAALDRQSRQLRLLFAALPAGVVSLDRDGRTRRANAAAIRLLGGDPVGELWLDFARGAFAVATGVDGEWPTRDGRRLLVSSAAQPEIGETLLLLTDVTETRALEQLAARNERLTAIGQMAAALAHQIRTPLAGAMLYLSQCRARTTDPRAGSLLERGLERLHHLEHLVRDMLVFARGKGESERVRIADLFRDVAEAVKGVQPPSAHLVIDGNDVLLELEGNLTALTAALSNLIANAFDSRPDVVVTLRAEQRGDRVELTVSDNGPGIAPSLRSRVFEPFFSTRPAGTGLGLAVVKTVADAHRAELALESAPGLGTRIGIALPRSADCAPALEVA